MQKSCSIKWVKLLPHFCNKFGKIWRAKFKVWPLIKISLYTATLLQDLFQNFGLIKFNLAKVSQYKVILAKLQNVSAFLTIRPPRAIWVAHITRDFLQCYYCSYYSSVLIRKVRMKRNCCIKSIMMRKWKYLPHNKCKGYVPFDYD